jgi:hypothetical protein
VRNFKGDREEYRHLLRRATQKLTSEECQKMACPDPPNDYCRTPWGQKDTPKRWYVKIPYIFAVVALRLERNIKGIGNPCPPA